MSRPRKPDGQKLQQFSIRLSPEDKRNLEDVAWLFGGSAKACEAAVRLLFKSLTAEQKAAIEAIKLARKAIA